MKKIFLLPLLIVWLVIGAIYAFADTADQVDAHSNTVVENYVQGISDISSGTTLEIDSTGHAYVRPKASSVARLVENQQGQLYTGACQLTGLELVCANANDYAEIYDGTSRGTYSTCIADPQGANANASVYVDFGSAPITISTGIYAYKNTAGSALRAYYR